MAKKSYNPFKMWGSWIGIVVALLIYTFFIPIVGCFLGCSLKTIYQTIQRGVPIETAYFDFDSGTLIWTPLTIILGFLIGWGIHSLIRRLRR
jgi:hypothetical protein